jgi:hypothetical protein
MARLSTFSREVFDYICEQLSEGATLKAILSDEALPSVPTFFRWMTEQSELREPYARATRAKAHALVDLGREAVDDGRNDWMEKHNEQGECIGWQLNGESVQRSKARADFYKWEASKLDPYTYGDRQIIDLNVNVAAMSYEALMERVHDLLRTGHLRLPPGVEIIEGELVEEERDDSDLA